MMPVPVTTSSQLDVPRRPAEVLVSQWLKSPPSKHTTNSIQFTIVNVELRAEEGRQWLALDYATHIRGDCEVTFFVEGGPMATRKTGLLVTPPDGPPVRRERFEGKCRRKRTR
jgi:hypothetical protein